MRKYAIWGTATSPAHEAWVQGIGKQFEQDGFQPVTDVAEADFVLNMFDPADPKAFRRSSRGTYSAAFYELPETPADVLKASYPMLVRTLSNVVLLRIPGAGVWFTTMERGTYHVPDDPAEISSLSSGTATRSPRTSRPPGAGSTSSISFRRRFRSRSTSRDATSGTSCVSTAWAAFHTGISPPARTRRASG